MLLSDGPTGFQLNHKTALDLQSLEGCYNITTQHALEAVARLQLQAEASKLKAV
jgi:hypothetical protein